MGAKFSQLSSQLQSTELTVNFPVNFSQLTSDKWLIYNEIFRNFKVNFFRSCQVVD